MASPVLISRGKRPLWREGPVNTSLLSGADPGKTRALHCGYSSKVTAPHGGHRVAKVLTEVTQNTE